MKIEKVEPTMEDIRYVAEHLNSANAKEIETFTRGSVEWIIDDITVSLRDYPDGMSAHCLKIDGVPIAIAGFFPTARPDGINCAWAYVTEDVHKYTVPFMRAAKEFLKEALEKGKGPFGNVTPAANKEIIRWVRSMGAEFSEPFTDHGNEMVIFWFGEVD